MNQDVSLDEKQISDNIETFLFSNNPKVLIKEKEKVTKTYEKKTKSNNRIPVKEPTKKLGALPIFRQTDELFRQNLQNINEKDFQKPVNEISFVPNQEKDVENFRKNFSTRYLSSVHKDPFNVPDLKKKTEIVDLDDEDTTEVKERQIVPNFTEKPKKLESLPKIPKKDMTKNKEKNEQVKDPSDIDALIVHNIFVDNKKYTTKNFQFSSPNTWKIFIEKGGTNVLVFIDPDQLLRFDVCYMKLMIIIQLPSISSFTIDEYDSRKFIKMIVSNDENHMRLVINDLKSLYPKINQLYKEVKDTKEYDGNNYKNTINHITNPSNEEVQKPKKQKRKLVEEDEYEISSDDEKQDPPPPRKMMTRRQSKKIENIEDDTPSLSNYSQRNNILFIRNNITFTQGDYDRLNNGEFLNDNNIDFYVEYLKETKSDETKNVYFFNTHFWPLLNRDRERIGKRFPKNDNIFDKDFVFVPINENAHWSLAVICYPNLLNEKVNEKETKARLFYFDSLGSTHRLRNVFEKIRQYLSIRHEVEKGEKRHIKATDIMGKSAKVPKQPNSYDCGVYLLHYIEKFIEEKPQPRDIDEGLEDWFDESDIPKKRDRMKSICDYYKEEYQIEHPNNDQLPLTNESNDSDLIEQIPIQEVINNAETTISDETKDIKEDPELFKENDEFKDEVGNVEKFVLSEKESEKSEKKKYQDEEESEESDKRKYQDEEEPEKKKEKKKYQDEEEVTERNFTTNPFLNIVKDM